MLLVSPSPCNCDQEPFSTRPVSSDLRWCSCAAGSASGERASGIPLFQLQTSLYARQQHKYGFQKCSCHGMQLCLVEPPIPPLQ